MIKVNSKIVTKTLVLRINLTPCRIHIKIVKASHYSKLGVLSLIINLAKINKKTLLNKNLSQNKKSIKKKIMNNKKKVLLIMRGTKTLQSLKSF